MIKLLNHNKQVLHLLTQVKNFYLDRDLQTADVLIYFSVQKLELYAADIKGENYLRTATDEFVIKEVNEVELGWIEVVGKLNTDELQRTLYIDFDSTEQEIGALIDGVLTGTTWTASYHDLPVKRRTVRMEEANPYTVILEAAQTYGYEIKFDTLSKVVHVYQKIGTNRGAYAYTDLNIKSIEKQSESYDLKTRLYAYGKDGLTFADINGGKAYVENLTYSNKIIETVWKDDRYTLKENLLADAQKKIDEISKPRLSYSVKLVELAKLNPLYSILDFQLGDEVVIMDRISGYKDIQRIVRLVEYPLSPELNEIELANKKITIVQQADSQKTAEIASGIVEAEITKLQTNLMTAIDAATTKITGNNGGFILTRLNEAGEPFELLIMNTDDIATATQVWRWNVNGLGYSSTGYSGQYTLAITADGKINADMVTTGTMTAERIKAGLLSSNDGQTWIDLTTGYFKLSNVSYGAGGFSIKMADGAELQTILTTTAEDISAKASSAMVENLSKLISEAELKITPGALIHTIRESTEYKTDLSDIDEKIGAVESSISTTFSNTLKEFTVDYESRVESVEGSVADFNSYLAFDKPAATLSIGSSSSDFKAKIKPDRFAISQGDIDVAYISNNQMKIKDAVILESLMFGNHKTMKLDSEITIFLWTGGAN